MLRFGKFAAVLLAATATTVNAGPASPDPSFGGHGFVTGPATVAYDVAVQADGRIVAVGTDQSLGLHVATVRYLPDGALDPTFGGGDGVVRAAYGPLTAVAIQPDGKIVVAGSAADPDPFGGFSTDFQVVRYAADGTLDPTFGGDGVVYTDFGSTDGALGMVLQPDGKIILVGLSGLGTLALARYLPDGSLDSSFGGDGTVVTSFPNGRATAVALQTDGKIVVVGWWHGLGAIAVARYLPSGALDTTFGSAGLVVTDPTSGLDVAMGVAIQPDGRIVVAGTVATNLLTVGQAVVLRYLANGVLDPSFDGDGIVTVAVGQPAFAQDVVLQPDGRIVVAGRVEDGFDAVLLARFEADGSLEPSLGITTTRLPGERTTGEAVALTADGQIVVVGETQRYVAPFGPISSVVIRYGTAFPVCWDGRVEGAEECDDANFIDGDCCSSSCTLDPAGTACGADANPCTLDQCDGLGTCQHPAGNEGGPCDDGDACTQDACQGGSCVGDPTPAPLCRGPVPPSRGGLFVRNHADPRRDQVRWQWVRGQATTPGEFIEQEYTFCMYDASAAPQPIARLETSGNMCGSVSCWRLRGNQPIYVNPAGVHDGITELSFTAGADTEARLRVRARGENLSTPALPLTPPVTVQLHSEAGDCWTASFSAPAKNAADVFRAKPD